MESASCWIRGTNWKCLSIIWKIEIRLHFQVIVVFKLVVFLEWFANQDWGLYIFVSLCTLWTGMALIHFWIVATVSGPTRPVVKPIMTKIHWTVKVKSNEIHKNKKPRTSWMFSLALTQSWPPALYWSSPCSCCNPLIWATLTAGCWWNSQLFLFIRVSALDLWSSPLHLTCLAMVDLKDPNNFRENSTFSPPCSSWQVHLQTTCLLLVSAERIGACFSLILSVCFPALAVSWKWAWGHQTRKSQEQVDWWGPKEIFYGGV